MTEIKRGRGRPRKEARNDGPYLDFVSGLGTNRDPSSYRQLGTAKIFSEGELEALYMNDGLARRIVDVPAQEMVRAGICIEVEGQDESEEEKGYAPVMARMEELGALEALAEGEKLARLYGGALLVLGVKDGGELAEPLNEASAKDIEFIRVYDRYRVSRMGFYDDPLDARFGQTKTYMVSPVRGNPYYVHESRCLVMQGEYTPERQRDLQDGWATSSLAQCYWQLQRVGVAHQWTEKLIERSQQAVNKITGMQQALGAPGGSKMLMDRLNILDMSRNVLNTVAIDSEDEYTVTSHSFAGLPDILDRFTQALCAVSGMPKTLLFGEQNKGLNNDGAGDQKNWAAQVKQWQKTKLLKHIDKIVRLLAISKNIPDKGYMIEFESIIEADAKQEAEIEKLKAEKKKIKADTANVYVTAGALDPSELRQTLIDDEEYIMDGSITIDPAEDDGAAA